ncbi:DEAD/DEAH box helicase [Salmonella enterica]|nr:DEAD/DEAH box helicase [Salmonella enterica]
MLQCGAKKVNPVEPFVTSLPVAAVLPELLTALKTAPQVLLSAPTGAGKSTWLPLQLLQQGPVAGKILLLEPRRLAARNVAQRLAEALNEKPGETVGYRMRAQSCVGPRTRLEVVTEGVLTRMIQRDPELRGVGLVILDEFHERSLQADLALALLLDIQQGLRDDLRLLIMSATLDNDRLCQRLPDAPTIVSEGRAFPVERRYQPLAAHLRFDEAVAMATAELLRNENGSLLLFLPGVGEIQRVHEHLASRVGSDVLLCPLYGALSLEAQRKAIVPAPAGMRKVVLATNIAETSLTIEGIRLVVDSAQERVARFDARTGLTRLVTQRISQASMTQRAAILEDPPRGGGTDLSVLFSRRQPGWQQRSQQLLKRLQVRNGEPDSALIMPLLARAFSDRIARRRGQEGRYQLANGMGAMLDADDALGRHEWLIAPLLLQGSASPDARILLAQPLDIASLIQACPDLLRQSDTVEWDEAQGTLKAWRRMRIGQLTVNVQPLAKPSEEELHQAMLNGIRDKGLAVLNWTPEAEQFRLRLHCAAKWLPEYDWPAVDEASLLATLENWLLPHMTGVQSLRSLKSLNVTQALRGLLDYAMLQRLDSELPGHYTVPTGSRITIRYHEDNPPALAVRMQEMFGEAKTPTIAQGRVPLVLELLSPAQRPLQITRDLSAFWQGAYREVQKEMKGRYPKHVWPDDPANTAPTRRTKKYS